MPGNFSYIAHTQNITIEKVKPENAGNYLCFFSAHPSIHATDNITVEVEIIEKIQQIQVKISNEPFIGLSSILFLAFLATVSYIAWKHKQRQRKTEDNGVQGQFKRTSSNLYYVYYMSDFSYKGFNIYSPLINWV